MNLGDRVVFSGQKGVIVRAYFLRKRDDWMEYDDAGSCITGFDWLEYNFPIFDVRLSSGRLAEGLIESQLRVKESDMSEAEKSSGGRHVIKAINAVKKWLEKNGGITKDRDAPQQAGGYQFRGIDDLYNVLCGVTAEAGLALFPEETTIERLEIQERNPGKYQTHIWLRVVTRIESEKDGSYVHVTTIGEGIDTSDKATNKSMSAAFKYAQIQVFQIPTHGDSVDSERDHIPVAPPPPKKEAKPEPTEPAPAKAEKVSKTEAKEAKKKAKEQETEPAAPKKSNGSAPTAEKLAQLIDESKSAKFVADMKDEIEAMEEKDQVFVKEHVVARVVKWLNDAEDLNALGEVKPLVAWLAMPDLKKSYMDKYQGFMQP